MNYILAPDGQTPVPEPDLMAFARWLEATERHVGNDTIHGVRVSTVFLGTDHGFAGPPVLWESMTFGAEPFDQQQERYTSYADALAGHRRWVEQVQAHFAADVPSVLPAPEE